MDLYFATIHVQHGEQVAVATPTLKPDIFDVHLEILAGVGGCYLSYFHKLAFTVSMHPFFGVETLGYYLFQPLIFRLQYPLAWDNALILRR